MFNSYISLCEFRESYKEVPHRFVSWYLDDSQVRQSCSTTLSICRWILCVKISPLPCVQSSVFCNYREDFSTTSLNRLPYQLNYRKWILYCGKFLRVLIFTGQSETEKIVVAIITCLDCVALFQGQSLKY